MKMYSPKKVFSNKPAVNRSHNTLRRLDCKCSFLIKVELIMTKYLFSEPHVHN